MKMLANGWPEGCKPTTPRELAKDPEPEELDGEGRLTDAVLDRFRGKRGDADLAADVLWAYEVFDDHTVKPGEAPSLGAWSLLTWARGARNRFFEQLVPKAIAAKKAEAGAMVKSEDIDPGLEEFERVVNSEIEFRRREGGK